MKQPPKIIWADTADDPDFWGERLGPEEISYVRGDVVDHLINTLNELKYYAVTSDDCQYGTLSTSFVINIVDEALKRLDE